MGTALFLETTGALSPDDSRRVLTRRARHACNRGVAGALVLGRTHSKRTNPRDSARFPGIFLHTVFGLVRMRPLSRLGRGLNGYVFRMTRLQESSNDKVSTDDRCRFRGAIRISARRWDDSPRRRPRAGSRRCARGASGAEGQRTLRQGRATRSLAILQTPPTRMMFAFAYWIARSGSRDRRRREEPS